MALISNPSHVCNFCHHKADIDLPHRLFWRCSACGLLSRSHAPSGDELARLYGAGWVEPEREMDLTGDMNAYLARTYARKLAASLHLHSLSGLKILDYGAGRGAMLTALQEAGVEAYGVEPFGCEYLRSRGLKAFATMDEIPKGINFDGIILMDVIEHMPEPWRVIRDLCLSLKDDGWMYLATPNAGGLKSRLLKGAWKQAVNPGHLYLFTAATLERILLESNLSPRRLMWFVSHKGRRMADLPSLLLQLLRLDGELRYMAYKR
jgi:2-polyprenyl-3-methyl-5-hydroxy-6-metoxy-1,4-benzoquinol methylase